MKLLIAFLLLIGSVAYAEDRVEVLGGTCRYTPVGNGVWYTEGYTHTLKMASACGFIGMSSIA